ncbi:MAG: FAD-dependent monooxygenase [Cyclobacteriaceae bacterium]
MKVAIIGCGFAGLSAALEIKHHEVTIFERSSELLPVGAGILLQPLGMAVLEQFEILNEVIGLGDRISLLSGSNTKGKQILNLEYSKYDPNRFGLGIHRGYLFKEVLKKVNQKEIKIKLGENVSTVTSYNGRYKFISNEKEYTDFDIVIACNGAKSTLRNKLKGWRYQREYPWGAFWGVFKNEGIATDVLYQKYAGTKQLFGLLPCGKNPVTDEKIVNFFWSIRKNHVNQTIQNGIESFKNEVFDLDNSSESVLTQIDSFDDLIFTTYHDVYCNKWNHDNLIFIGDSIHGMSPQLGIGLNMALFDGYLLGQVLNSPTFKIDDLTKLKNYRHRQNLYYHLTSQLLTRFFQSDFNILGAFRDLVFPKLPHIRPLDQLMIDSLCGHKTGFFGTKSPHEQIEEFSNQITY